MISVRNMISVRTTSLWQRASPAHSQRHSMHVAKGICLFKVRASQARDPEREFYVYLIGKTHACVHT